MKSRRLRLAALALAAALVLLPPVPQASAQQQQPRRQQQQLPVDPLEKLNRPIFKFNDALDRWVLEPIATGYDKVMPDRAQTWVNNFFTNLRFPIVFANCLLQGKLEESGKSFGRFIVNSTIGVAGFGDPATRFNIDKPNEDFGQTLGKWGLQPGAYLVVPFLGPSDIRDVFGLGVDGPAHVWPFFVDAWVTSTVTGLDAINTRSLYLEEVRDARSRSLDYYTFVRDAYLQRRQSLVDDKVGNATKDKPSSLDDDLYFPDPELD